MWLTTDEIVVAKKYRASGPEPVEEFQFRDDLLRRLVTGLASEKVHHIAEFAVKRASPGSLDCHGIVIVQPQQIKPWNRGGSQVRPLVVFDHAGLAVSHRLQKQRNRSLAFAPHYEINPRFQGCLGE
jgi:hypothetical protein